MEFLSYPGDSFIFPSLSGLRAVPLLFMTDENGQINRRHWPVTTHREEPRNVYIQPENSNESFW